MWAGYPREWGCLQSWTLWFSRVKSDILTAMLIPSYLKLFPDCSGIVGLNWKSQDIGRTVDLFRIKANFIRQVCFLNAFTITIFRIAAARGSINIANIDGESRQPCLVPLLRLKLGEIWSFVLTHDLGELYNILTHDKKFPPNLNFFRVANRNSLFTLSKLFSASKEIIMASLFGMLQ